jgi:hypothetical protein
MKTCFILNYWADNEDKVKMVNQCVSQIKKTGYDTIYTSMYPIHEDIVKNFKHVIYSDKNELITITDLLNTNNLELRNTFSYYPNSLPKWYSIPLNFKDVGFSVHRQIISNLEYLKSIGYTHFHFLVADCLITDDEIDRFKIIEDFVSITGKKSYFENLTNHFKGFGAVYFYSEIDFFIKNFKKYETKEEYLQYNSFDKEIRNIYDLSFEFVLKNSFKDNLTDIVLIDNNTEDKPISVFKNSQIDIIKSYNKTTQYALIPNTNQDKYFIFVCCMDKGNYNISINGDNFELYLNENQYLHRETNLCEFNLKFYKNGVLDFEIDINSTNIKKICSYSFFTEIVD